MKSDTLPLASDITGCPSMKTSVLGEVCSTSGFHSRK